MADTGLRHFLDLSEFDASILRGILDDAGAHKRARGNGGHKNTSPLAGRTLAMIFEQPSTRTRIFIRCRHAPAWRREHLSVAYRHADRPRRGDLRHRQGAVALCRCDCCPPASTKS